MWEMWEGKARGEGERRKKEKERVKGEGGRDGGKENEGIKWLKYNIIKANDNIGLKKRKWDLIITKIGNWSMRIHHSYFLIIFLILSQNETIFFFDY
jgi:hypothetical protein